MRALIAKLATGVLVLLLSVPLTASAQQAEKAFKIGILSSGSPVYRDGVKIFKQSLFDLGYVEGRRVVFEERFVESAEGFRNAATELSQLTLDVLVAFTTQPAMAAKAATKTIPIVFAVVSDPVDSGLVATLARPGSNATGVALMQPDLSAKQLQLLKETLPQLSRVAVLWNAAHRGKMLEFKEIETAAPVLGIDVLSVKVRTQDDFRSAFSTLDQQSIQALIVLTEPLVVSQWADIRSFVTKRRLPDMYQDRSGPMLGGLLSYAPNVSEQFSRAGSYVVRILLGARPADLPVEQPTRFELVINLKTAKMLGLTIPQSILLRADEVIR